MDDPKKTLKTFVFHEEEVRGLHLPGGTYDATLRRQLVDEFNRMSKTEQSWAVGLIIRARATRVPYSQALHFATNNGISGAQLDSELMSQSPNLQLIDQTREYVSILEKRATDYERALSQLLNHYEGRNYPEAAQNWARSKHADVKNIKNIAQRNLKVIKDFYRQRRRDNFMFDDLDEELFGDGQHWEGVLDLGGGMSRAGLWVRLDENDRIIDRIVRKCDYSEPYKWYRPRNWHGDPHDRNNCQPMEFYLQNTCADAAPNHFSKIRAWGADEVDCITSLYVEFCAHGDLYHSVERPYVPEPGLKVPETFLWMLFLQLAECCLVMQKGMIGAGSNPDWAESNEKVEIVHQDLKPGNIFLDFGNEDYFPLYPSPKMADFGLALHTGVTDKNNPKEHGRGAGTMPFVSPEQDYWNIPEHLRGPLLAHTNIYGIGAIMYALSAHQNRQVNRPSDLQNFRDPKTNWQFSGWSRQTYSKRLIFLIGCCIEWDFSRRPSPKTLRDEILKAIQGMPGEKGDYLRKAMKRKQDKDPELGLRFKKDVYKLGFSLVGEHGRPDDWGSDGGEGFYSDVVCDRADRDHGGSTLAKSGPQAGAEPERTAEAGARGGSAAIHQGQQKEAEAQEPKEEEEADEGPKEENKADEEPEVRVNLSSSKRSFPFDEDEDEEEMQEGRGAGN